MEILKEVWLCVSLGKIVVELRIRYGFLEFVQFIVYFSLGMRLRLGFVWGVYVRQPGLGLGFSDTRTIEWMLWKDRSILGTECSWFCTYMYVHVSSCACVFNSVDVFLYGEGCA